MTIITSTDKIVTTVEDSQRNLLLRMVTTGIESYVVETVLQGHAKKVLQFSETPMHREASSRKGWGRIHINLSIVVAWHEIQHT